MRKNILPLTLAFAAMILMVAAVSAENSTAKHDHMASVAKVGESAPDFTLMSANGEKVSLSDYRGKYVVLEWINFGCPFVKKHYGSGNMQQLQKKYTDKEVVWLSICSSAPGMQGYFKGDDLKSEIKAHDFAGSAYLIDSDGSVGHMYQAKTTPNMYVINPDGQLVYAGAIDDKPTPRAEDIEGSTNYVVSALDMSMAGKSLKVTSTQPYGCGVKYAKK